jgi:hypothetical protein
VIGDNQANFGQKVAMPQLFKCAGWIESGDDEVSAAPQNRLPHSSLHRIVVYQKNRLFTWHLQLQGERSDIVYPDAFFS